MLLWLVAEHGAQPVLCLGLWHALPLCVLVHLLLGDLSNSEVLRLLPTEVQTCMGESRSMYGICTVTGLHDSGRLIHMIQTAESQKQCQILEIVSTHVDP